MTTVQDINIEKSFCTTREAATLLGVSVGTVQLWVESGLLQAWKTPGGHRRVLRDSVESLLHKKVEPQPPEATPARRATDPRRMRVMVVENDSQLLRVYTERISRWPMAPEVTPVDNTVAALVMMGRNCPDLLVIDLHMPGMNGFKMLRALRLTPEMAQATIVVVTSGDAVDIHAHGGIPPDIEVLPKPVALDRLLAIASDIVNQRRFQVPLA